MGKVLVLQYLSGSQLVPFEIGDGDHGPAQLSQNPLLKERRPVETLAFFKRHFSLVISSGIDEVVRWAVELHADLQIGPRHVEADPMIFRHVFDLVSPSETEERR